MEKNQAWRMFASAHEAILGTVDAVRGVHLVPVVFTPVDESRIVIAIDAKPKRTRRLRRLENVGHDNRVSLIVDHYDDDWSELWWVRVDGHATVVDQVDEAVSSMHRLRYPQAASHELGPWIDIAVSAVSGWHA